MDSSGRYFGLNIMDLGAGNLADAGDEASGRVILARLFRASDWKELKKLCEEVSPAQPFVKEVAGIMSIANADERERVELESARRHAERMADLDARMERLTRREAEALKKVEEAENRVAEAEKREAEAKNRMTEAEKREAEADKKKAEAQVRADDLEKENAMLRERLQKLEKM